VAIGLGAHVAREAEQRLSLGNDLHQLPREALGIVNRQGLHVLSGKQDLLREPVGPQVGPERIRLVEDLATTWDVPSPPTTWNRARYGVVTRCEAVRLTARATRSVPTVSTSLIRPSIAR